MQPVSDKRFCCGCETCAVCCPQHCIRMEEDEEGFRYPVTDRERCTGCGLCERICPERHPAAARTPVECLAARARDAAMCAAGSSGGIFPLLAAATIRSGGVVFGAVFTPEGEVVNVNVLEQAETPGLGTKMADEGNPLLGSIQGQKLEEKKLVDGKLAVTKDGGDVDALTAATISSRAYVDAVNRAWMAYKSVATGVTPADVATGATAAAQTNEPEAQKGGTNE